MAAYRRCPAHVCRNILQRGIALAEWDIRPLGCPGASKSVPEPYVAGAGRGTVSCWRFSVMCEPQNFGLIRPDDPVLAAAAHKDLFGQLQSGQIDQIIGHLDSLGRQA